MYDQLIVGIYMPYWKNVNIGRPPFVYMGWIGYSPERQIFRIAKFIKTFLQYWMVRKYIKILNRPSVKTRFKQIISKNESVLVAHGAIHLCSWTLAK